MSVTDLREYGAEFTANPYPYYAKLRASGPVHEILTPEGIPAWLIVGYDEARAALADQRLIKDPSVVMDFVPLEFEVIGPNLLGIDPPDHTRLRKLVAGEFTGRRVEALRPRIQQLTDELLDAMAPAGRADLVDSFAFPLPITVICELLGVPAADRDSFRAWSNELVAPTGAMTEREAVEGFGGYLDELIEDKRAAGPRDDLLSALIATRAEDGDRLSLPELRALAYLLLIAGHETTVNLIAGTVRLLLTHPDQLAALRADPGLVDAAIEEGLRFDGPVEAATYRFSSEDVEIAGTVIPAGSVVLVGLAASARDAARFPDPDRFDVHRDPRGHLAFGHGIHYCLGAPLARLEGKIAIRSLLERFPRLELDPDAGSLEWLPGLLIRGTRRLPVVW
ncbi:cytochrome P450 [Streptomyces sp. SKN60]|uniref:cytochrome P450 family protein n=1 Tax=Streptomyces sp. SKN60 TaxID=2855506 RepID=UPI00224790C1|nr:cytochrome P450 [Streptomyces sp. SKN60]MCX2184637.1 cytochrome P450 [Streptomyces sp. SKN60]